MCVCMRACVYMHVYVHVQFVYRDVRVHNMHECTVAMGVCLQAEHHITEYVLCVHVYTSVCTMCTARDCYYFFGCRY